jgi:hypothetical protein
MLSRSKQLPPSNDAPGGSLIERSIWIHKVDTTPGWDPLRLTIDGINNSLVVDIKYNGLVEVGTVVDGPCDDMIPQYQKSRTRGIMRVIEVRTNKMYMVTSPEFVPRYAAVSHAWNDTKSVNSTTGSISREAYRRIAECIGQIPIGFMWLDIICLNQEVECDVAHGIRNMDFIYSNAYVTLCDITCETVPMQLFANIFNIIKSDPPEADIFGGSILPQQVIMNAALANIIDKGEWIKRVWTVQEVLLSSSLAFLINGFMLGNAPMITTIREMCYEEEKWKTKPYSALIMEVGGMKKVQEIHHEIVGSSWWSLISTVMFGNRSFSCFKMMAGRFSSKEEDLAYSMMSILESDSDVVYGIGVSKAMKSVLMRAKKLPSVILGAGSWRVSLKKNTDSWTAWPDADQRWSVNAMEGGINRFPCTQSSWIPEFLAMVRADGNKAIMWARYTMTSKNIYFIRPVGDGVEIPENVIISKESEVELTVDQLCDRDDLFWKFISLYKKYHGHDDHFSQQYHTLQQVKSMSIDKKIKDEGVSMLINHAARHIIHCCSHYIFQENRYRILEPDIKKILTTQNWDYIIFDDEFGDGDSYIMLSYGVIEHGVLCKTKLTHKDEQGHRCYHGTELVAGCGNFVRGSSKEYSVLY